jgi:CheY-like chemotaxis protein
MSSRESAYHRPHVLVVTDDEGLRDFLSEGLVIGGFWVSVVASALQTLEVFRLRTFDLALIDLQLGGMSAIELIQRLRSSDPDSVGRGQLTDIPILGITGSSDESVILEARDAGADEILSPPIELEALVPYLHRIVLGWRELHPERPWADEIAQLKEESD